MKNLSSFVLIFCLCILAGLLAINSAFAIERIDINSAPLKSLVKITHIGEARAKELISLRPFSSLDDLTKIKGISQARIKDIKKQGLAWAGGEIENSLVRESKKALAATNEQIPEKPFFFFAPIAFPLAIFSGIIVLILKKNLKAKIN